MSKNRLVKVTEFSGVFGPVSAYFFNLSEAEAKHLFEVQRGLGDYKTEVIEFDDAVSIEIDYNTVRIEQWPPKAA